MSEDLRETFPNISEDCAKLNESVIISRACPHGCKGTVENAPDSTPVMVGTKGHMIPLSDLIKQKPKQPQAHPERDLQDRIIGLAYFTGWKPHAERHAWTKKGYRTPIQGDAGFPDIVLIRGGEIIFWECKVHPKKPTPAQQLWIDLLALVPGVISRVVYDEDWEYIVETLTESK